jgi:hypothetical protein
MGYLLMASSEKPPCTQHRLKRMELIDFVPFGGVRLNA